MLNIKYIAENLSLVTARHQPHVLMLGHIYFAYSNYGNEKYISLEFYIFLESSIFLTYFSQTNKCNYEIKVYLRLLLLV